jgi:CRP/FNR family transcriptional regulator, cyclic AMP receptor protein
MMPAPSIAAALRNVALFQDLPDQELDALVLKVARKRFGRNALIFSQGDAGDGLHIVEEGHVTISRQNADGGEVILSLCEPGEYFGELALFDGEPRSASATAVEECTTLYLSRSTFRAFLEAHPKALLTCLAVIVRLLRRCTDLVDEIALLDLRRRLARRLLRLAGDGIVGVGEAGRPSTSFRITQQQLASMLGATRESVNKHLNAFVDEGTIRLERGRIHLLDLERLERCSNGSP